MNVFLSTVKQGFSELSPHMRALGYEIEELDEGHALARLPYSPDLIGDPFTGVLHGGVVTTLLDTTGGAAVLAAVQEVIGLATLDLRVDYLRPAREGRDIRARVECYRLTPHIAFTRGIAFDLDEKDPVASMSATYMLRTQLKREAGGGNA